MGNFDMETYLNNKFGNVGQSKIDEIEAAKADKLAKLNKFREDLAATAPQFLANKESWVGRNGVNPDSALGTVMNAGASVVSGISRLEGNLVAMPTAISSAVDMNTATEGSVDAYNRMKQGKATPADMALLNDKRYTPDPYDTPEEQALKAKQVMESKVPTNLELLDKAAKNSQVTNDINRAFDRSSLVHSGNREALGQDLKAGFTDAWNEYKAGGQQMYDAMGKPYGDGMLEGAGNAVAGMARLIYNAGEAAVKNPKAVIEYAAENAPQLLLGLAGKAGSIAQGATNVGYAIDNFHQGIQNYAEKNNGQMPSDEERQTMAFQAASLALAEQVGDRIGTAAITKGAKVGTSVETGSAKEAFKNALGRTGTAATEGLASEAPTEGYQTYMEGKITGKEASAADIYTGSVIGGLSGAALSGGGHAVHELVARATGTSEEQVKARQKQQVELADFKQAVTKNDPSAYLNPEDSNYSPSRAASVLHAHALQSSDPDVKQANLEKANQILGQTEDHLANKKEDLAFLKLTPEARQKRIDGLEARIAQTDPADTGTIKAITDIVDNYKSLQGITSKNDIAGVQLEITGLEKEIEKTRNIQKDFTTRVETATAETVQAAVTRADAVIDPTDTAGLADANKATEHLITLSMQNTSHLTAETANQLASNTKNSLTESQRQYLRTFSEARIAENALKNSSEVNQDILIGGTGFIGIENYRSQIGHALSYSDPKVASEKLDALMQFAEGHQDKATVFSQAQAKVNKSGGQIQIVKTDTGWEQSKTLLNDKQLKANGGMNITPGSGKIVAGIVKESRALNASVKELQAAISLKQPSVSVTPSVATVSPVAPTTPIAPAVAPSPKIVTPIVKNETVKTATTSEFQAIQKVLDAIDIGGVPLDAKKLNDLGRAIGLEINKKDKPEKTISRLREALDRHLSEQGNSTAETTAVANEGVAEVQPTKVVEASPEQKAHEKALKAAKRAFNKIKRQNPVSLWTSLKHTLSESDLGDIYGSEWKKRYTMMRGKPGADLSTAVANGLLDEFLPHEMRFGTGLEHAPDSGVEQDAVEYIKDLLRSGNYLTYETNMMLRVADENIQQLEDEYSTQEILDAIDTLTAETQSTEESTTDTTEVTAKSEPVGSTDTSVAEENATEVVEPKGLNVLNQPKSVEGTEFRKKNLVTEFFTQAKDKITDLTARPLVEVKDFLSQLIKGKVGVLDYVSLDNLTDKQEAVINLYKTTAKVWNSKFQGMLSEKSPTKGHDISLFRYEDMVQFLLEKNPDTGKVDLEENIKTAMSTAAFLWIAENAGKGEFNEAEEINLILQRDEDTDITPEEWSALGKVGTRENVIRNALGQKAVKALGLKLTKGASKDMLSRMESALGAHIEAMLLNEGLLTRTTIPGSVMKTLTKNENTKADAKFYFLKATHVDGKLAGLNKQIHEANKDTGGVLNKLFDVESDMKYPIFEPIPLKQKTTKNTNQRIPKILARIVNAKNHEANYLRQDMWNVLSQLDDSIALKMAGAQDVYSNGTHVANRDSLDAKNDGLMREYQNAKEFFGGMEDNTIALYFEHSIWKQQRVGIATNMINPQTSKIHRFMLYRKAWETKVNIANSEEIKNFQLRVAEGLGVKTEKMSEAAALAEFAELVKTPEIKRAVAVLRKMNSGESVSLDLQQILSDGVKKGGSNFHSLDALMALAHYAEAKSTGEKTFTVHMMGEVDGVTNGPMLSHLLLGAAYSADSLYGLHNRGGF